MSIKMTLISSQRLKSLEQMAGLHSSTRPASHDVVKSTQTPDVKLKLLREKRIRKTKKPSVEKKKKIILEESVHPTNSKIRERQRAFIKHLDTHKDRIEYDKHSGELSFDGKLSGDSDIRELMASISTDRKQDDSIRGWDTLKDALASTDAPAGIYAKLQRRSKNKRGDWGAM